MYIPTPVSLLLNPFVLVFTPSLHFTPCSFNPHLLHSFPSILIPGQTMSECNSATVEHVHSRGAQGHEDFLQETARRRGKVSMSHDQY